MPLIDPQRLTILAGVLLSMLGIACHAPAVTAGLGAAQLASRGSFGASENGTIVQTNMKSLGLAQNVDVVLPRLYLRDGVRRLELSGFEVGLSGSGAVEADITINSQTLTANTDVNSRFAMGAYSGVLTWDVARFEETTIGVGVGIEWVSLDVGLDETTGTLSLNSDQQFPLPLLGIRIENKHTPVSGHVSLGWIALESPSVSATVLDVDARLEAHLVGGQGMKLVGMLGYRGFELDVSYDDGASQVESDFKFGGPYAGFRLRF